MTADWLDSASEHEQEMRDDAIAEIRRQASIKEGQYHAHCQWCGDDSLGHEFCCKDCRDDAERAELSARRNGK